MNLFVFAHKGEAQAFIKNSKFTSSDNFNNLYQNHDGDWLLICGEGTEQALLNTALCVGQLQNKIKNIVSLGIAAGLNKTLRKNHIYPIRTCYHQGKFKSFSTVLKTKIDCISASDRVLKKNEIDNLDNFAPIVDRESWAVGFVAEQTKKNFYCYKIISDFPQEETNCSEVRDLALSFSEKLYSYILENFYSKEPRESSDNVFQIYENDSFYFTKAQKNQYESHIEKLRLKLKASESDILMKVEIKELEELKSTPKERTTSLIEELSFLLNPLKKSFIEKTSNFTQPFKELGHQIKIDTKMETSDFHIQAHIRNSSDKDALVKALNNLSYSDFEACFDGDLNV